DRVLARGRGVQLAAERVEGLGDLLRAVGRRSLEEQVLEKVGDAGLRVGLVARAGADPEADRDGAHVREPLRDHALAGVELGQDVALHGRIVLAAVARLVAWKRKSSRKSWPRRWTACRPTCATRCRTSSSSSRTSPPRESRC